MRLALPALAFAALAVACSAAPAPTPDDSNDPSGAEGTKSPTTPTSPNAPPAPPGATPPGTPPSPPGPRPDISAFPGSKIYEPPTLPAPGIVMLHGSEGGAAGYIDDYAKDLAKRGFVVVTMCWFGCTGKPDKILRIPLESVIDIGNWLATSPDVSAGKVGLFGWSRGAEMSLLVSAVSNTSPFKAVAVHAPSDTVVGAFDPAQENTPPNYGGIGELDPKTGKTIPSPSWTWGGKDIWGEPSMDFDTPGPLINVVAYTGPMYVSQGLNDEVWPVTRGKHVVAERNAVSGLVTQSHFWPGEGHVLMNPSDITTFTNELVTFFQGHL